MKKLPLPPETDFMVYDVRYRPYKKGDIELTSKKFVNGTFYLRPLTAAARQYIAERQRKALQLGNNGEDGVKPVETR